MLSTIQRTLLRFFYGFVMGFLSMVSCSDNDLGLERRGPNLPPYTEISASPPDSSNTNYRVPVFWWGRDPDGSIEHFDYILIVHPAAHDSIGGDDHNRVVVTVPEFDDPRWQATQSLDTLIVTLADTLRRDPWPHGRESEEDVRNALFERWHTFFVRAVDNEGLPDPTPDYVTFNSTNLAPIVGLNPPVNEGLITDMPVSFEFTWQGRDPVGDGSVIQPVASRWVLISSGTQGNNYTSWPDSLYTLPSRFSWSPWTRWESADGSGTSVKFRNVPALATGSNPPTGYYIFAVQAMDEAGAVTSVFDRTTQGKNNATLIRVSADLGPLLIVDEQFLGTRTFVGSSSPTVVYDIAEGQTVEFHWQADAAHYGGIVQDFRFAWDLNDATEDSEWDQGWSEAATSSPSRLLTGGIHTFRLQVRDTADNITSVLYFIRSHRMSGERDVLWVDDTASSIPGSAEDGLEDGRWTSVLTKLAEESGFSFDPATDVYDRGLLPPTVDLVFRYKAVVWSIQSRLQSSTRFSALRTLAQFYDPFVPRNRNIETTFNYLPTYLKNGGCLWINGHRPAADLWPTERAPGAQFDPVNVTNWDDPQTPHPFIDSVGTKSLLYLLGVEMFDVGSGGGTRLEQIHSCIRPDRINETGVTDYYFITTQDDGHAHAVLVEASDFDFSFVGVRLLSEDRDGHRHAISLTPEEAAKFQRGRPVSATTHLNEEGTPHQHVVELMDVTGFLSVPAAIPGTGWDLGGGGRSSVEIYNMPNALLSAAPPLQPPEDRSCTVYRYQSGVPEDPDYYPLTADRQPMFLLTRGSLYSDAYNAAICGFPPFRLNDRSHENLARFVLVRHFGLGSR